MSIRSSAPTATPLKESKNTDTVQESRYLPAHLLMESVPGPRVTGHVANLEVSGYHGPKLVDSRGERVLRDAGKPCSILPRGRVCPG